MEGKGYANPDLLMTPAQLHVRLQDPSICTVDVRPTHEYVSGHIPGSAPHGPLRNQPEQHRTRGV